LLPAEVREYVDAKSNEFGTAVADSKQGCHVVQYLPFSRLVDRCPVANSHSGSKSMSSVPGSPNVTSPALKRSCWDACASRSSFVVSPRGSRLIGTFLALMGTEPLRAAVRLPVAERRMETSWQCAPLLRHSRDRDLSWMMPCSEDGFQAELEARKQPGYFRTSSGD
jgi:hypothetical protein